MDPLTATTTERSFAMPGIPHPYRRGPLAAGGAAGLGVLLAACGRSSAKAAETGGKGPWSFTDDHGRR
jgi:iron complex transport system substrate-binding protein